MRPYDDNIGCIRHIERAKLLSLETEECYRLFGNNSHSGVPILRSEDLEKKVFQEHENVMS